jgi:hypothetical protein
MMEGRITFVMGEAGWDYVPAAREAAEITPCTVDEPRFGIDCLNQHDLRSDLEIQDLGAVTELVESLDVVLALAAILGRVALQLPLQLPQLLRVHAVHVDILRI